MPVLITPLLCQFKATGEWHFPDLGIAMCYMWLLVSFNTLSVSREIVHTLGTV